MKLPSGEKNSWTWFGSMRKSGRSYREGTLAQFLEEYVELYGRIHWACSTYTSNEGFIRNYIVPFMGSMWLLEFSPKVIAALYGKLQSDPKITPSVLTNIHKLLHSAFEQAVLWEYIPRKPFQKANVPKVFPIEIPMLTIDEIKTLIQNCDNHMLSLAIHLAFAGSLRKGEILALTWDDIDFQKGTVTVSKTLKRVRRDAVDVLNGKDVLYQFPAVFDEGRTVAVLKLPKTKSSIRTVYLPDYVLDTLQEWKATLKPIKRNHPDLVMRYSNGRPLSEETLLHLLQKQLLQLGLPAVSFHSLRHSRKAKENATHLSALADDIAENFEECDDVFLTAEAVAETIKIAEYVYNFSKRVRREQHMFIFLFQAKHRTEDSFCRCMKMADGSVAADIYMLIPLKDLEATLQSMLLHELGHCVNIVLTGDPETPPEDFTLVMKLIGADTVECDTPEFFAHCFAMSLLIEPGLLSADPFKMVPRNHKQMFRNYLECKFKETSLSML